MYRFLKKISATVFIITFIFNISIVSFAGEAKTNENNVIVEQKLEEWGSDFLEVSLSYPDIKIPDNPVAEKFVNDTLNEYMDRARAAAKDIESKAKKDKDVMISPYHCVTDYVVTYNKNNLFSVTMIYGDFTGGANWMSANESFNFDLSSPKRLSIVDMFKDGTSENMMELIDKNILDGFENSKKLIYKFENIDRDTKFYLNDTYIEIYFDLYQYTPYSEGFPSFKLPYTMFGNNLKYDFLNNTNFRYNDEDIVTILEEKSSYEEKVPYMLSEKGFDIKDSNSEDAMIYTAAKFIDDNFYRYYITSDEIETFIYHVYGRKIDSQEIFKDIDTELFKPLNLKLKNGVYYFSALAENGYWEVEKVKEVSNGKGAFDIYGIMAKINDYDEIEDMYGFKFTYSNSANSALKYNINNYICRKLDYENMVVNEIDKIILE